MCPTIRLRSISRITSGSLKMEDLQRVILVHYHEIGLKGHNRSKFEKRLVRNLEALLTDYPLVTIHRISGRLIVFLKEGCDKDVAFECARFISRVPGVARVSCGFKCERDKIGRAHV